MMLGKYSIWNVQIKLGFMKGKLRQWENDDEFLCGYENYVNQSKRKRKGQLRLLMKN